MSNLFDSLVEASAAKSRNPDKAPEDVEEGQSIELPTPTKIVFENIPYIGMLVYDLLTDTGAIYNEKGDRRQLHS